MKPLKEIDFMITKTLMSNLKKEHKSDFKDMVWGMLWFGWAVVPILYVVLVKEKSGRLQL